MPVPAPDTSIVATNKAAPTGPEIFNMIPSTELQQETTFIESMTMSAKFGDPCV
jgi:hypothetical protein